MRFADIEILRYRVPGFEELSLRQKTLVYHLTEAALWGRDILADQNCALGLRLRRLLETVYTSPALESEHGGDDFRALQCYLRRVWFSSGPHHHYGGEKFRPDFSEQWLRRAVERTGLRTEAQEDLFRLMFRDEVAPQRVCHTQGQDLLLGSAMNYYAPGITQREAEHFYALRREKNDPRPVMLGLNSRLERDAQTGELYERTWRVGGMYSPALSRVCAHLLAARPWAENAGQQHVLDLLMEFYHTGSLRTFDDYCIAWLRDTESQVDFTNGFTETYGDPLGLKASWEAYVNLRDEQKTRRTERLAADAQWFEDHAPVDPAFRKRQVRGVSAKVINAAILAGDLYPSTAIGINLPNSDWVRREHGSKSVTIGNITEACRQASRQRGVLREFLPDQQGLQQKVEQWGELCDELHTDLHECLGHGSGQLLPGISGEALGPYASTLEEARADLFGLYFITDERLTQLGLTPSPEAASTGYSTYMTAGLLTQLARIEPGRQIEEAHMRNRALICRWALELDPEAAQMVRRDGKTYVVVRSWRRLRAVFARELAEVQRIKSTGAQAEARSLVERYGVSVDPTLHAEVRQRYDALGVAPYKGFVNPRYTALRDPHDGHITDVRVSYDETYDEQMLRYSRTYSAL